MLYGDPSGRHARRWPRWSAALERGGIPAQAVADIRMEVWLKLWGNSNMNPLSALSRRRHAGDAGRPRRRRAGRGDDAGDGGDRRPDRPADRAGHPGAPGDHPPARRLPHLHAAGPGGGAGAGARPGARLPGGAGAAAGGAGADAGRHPWADPAAGAEPVRPAAASRGRPRRSGRVVGADGSSRPLRSRRVGKMSIGPPSSAARSARSPGWASSVPIGRSIVPLARSVAGSASRPGSSGGSPGRVGLGVVLSLMPRSTRSGGRRFAALDRCRAGAEGWRHREASAMLELRPCCECCGTDLPPASADGADLFLRVHLLRRLRRRGPAGRLPELRRRAGPPPGAPRREAAEAPRQHDPQGEAAGLFVRLTPDGLMSGGKLARPKGFEPLTPRSEVWCSIRLSYGRCGSKGTTDCHGVETPQDAAPAMPGRRGPASHPRAGSLGGSSMAIPPSSGVRKPSRPMAGTSLPARLANATSVPSAEREGMQPRS